MRPLPPDNLCRQRRRAGWQRIEALGNLAGALESAFGHAIDTKPDGNEAAEGGIAFAGDIRGAHEAVSTLAEPALSILQTPPDQETELQPSSDVTPKTASPEISDMQVTQLASSITPVSMVDGFNPVSNEKAGGVTECDPGDKEEALIQRCY